MSASPTQPANLAELERLRRELTEKTDLVQSVRTELIRSQITVLELQDTVLQKETDKADAVSILGQAELVLEGKINYIFELDRVLNAKIAVLQQELAAAQQAQAEDRKARDQIAEDLAQKLDQTNRALADAHALAGNYARDASETRDKLQARIRDAATLREQLDQARTQLASAVSDSAVLRDRLAASEAGRSAAERELAAIHTSVAWRATAPLRALFRRKS